MADITEYSDIQQKAMKEIVKLDSGLHTTFLISDLPLYGMLDQLDNGEMVVKRDVACSLSTGVVNYDIRIWYSVEQSCWFYTLSYLGEEVTGVVHYNTALNAMGELSFAFLNDNEEDKDLSNSLPYSNIFIMRK